MGHKKKKYYNEVDRCPICDNEYQGQRRAKTRHHIFPKWWYKDDFVLCACAQCHQREFHIKYPMNYQEVWSPTEYLQNWVRFCKSKGKDALKIYPQLLGLIQ